MKIKNTLVIEDSELDQYILNIYLQRANISDKVTFKYNALEALNYLKQIGAEEFPELIFLDLNMPVMNGFEFLAAFGKLPAEQTKRTKVVVLSSSEDPLDAERSEQNEHVIKFVSKPVNEQKLDIIRQML